MSLKTELLKKQMLEEHAFKKVDELSRQAYDLVMEESDYSDEKLKPLIDAIVNLSDAVDELAAIMKSRVS